MGIPPHCTRTLLLQLHQDGQPRYEAGGSDMHAITNHMDVPVMVYWTLVAVLRCCASQCAKGWLGVLRWWFQSDSAM